MPALGVGDLSQQIMNLKISGSNDQGFGGRRRSNRSRSRGSRPDSRPASRARSMSGVRQRQRSASVSSNSSGRYHSRRMNHSSPEAFEDLVRSNYHREDLRMVERYFDENAELAEVSNNVLFLDRCRSMGYIPKDYWVFADSFKNTREIRNILDKCSFHLLCQDLEANRKRSRQLTAHLDNMDDRLSTTLQKRDYKRLLDISADIYDGVFERIQQRQRKEFEALRRDTREYQKQLEGKKGKPRGRRSFSRSRRGPKGDGESPNGKVQRRRVNSEMSSVASP